MKKNRITVFTPTFNRKDKLKRLYFHLCNQTNLNFVWLIIDDGSTDHTKEFVEEITSKAPFTIKYIWIESHGKQYATNIAIDNTTSDYFAFVDSDDYYLESTVNVLYELIDKIDSRKDVSGICARRGYDSNTFVGSSNINFTEKTVNMDYMIKKYNFHGDTCRMYKTAILKANKYPYYGEKFIPEDLLYSKIDMMYDIYFYNKILSITEYNNEGYTKNQRRIYNENPKGYYNALNQLSLSKRGFSYLLKIEIIIIIWYLKYPEVRKFGINKKIRFMLVFIPGYILYKLNRPSFLFNN